MKTLILTLLSLSVTAHAETLNPQKLDFTEIGWFALQCHDSKGQNSFYVSVSSDAVNGTRQVTEAEVGGEMNQHLQFDVPVDSKKPLVSLASVRKGGLKILLRYENGLMWDNYVTIHLRAVENGFAAAVEVSGDEGTYQSEKMNFECALGRSYGARTTPRYDSAKLGFKSYITEL